MDDATDLKENIDTGNDVETEIISDNVSNHNDISNISDSLDDTGKYRAKKSNLPTADEEKKNPVSYFIFTVLIIALIGFSIWGFYYIKSQKTDEKSGITLKTVKISTVNVKIPSNSILTKLEDGKIDIDGSIYSPVTDAEGNIIVYVDENGNEYPVDKKVSEISINIPSDSIFTELKDGKIDIDGTVYTPVIDVEGNVIAYVDENGNEYSVDNIGKNGSSVTLPGYVDTSSIKIEEPTSIEKPTQIEVPHFTVPNY